MTCPAPWTSSTHWRTRTNDTEIGRSTREYSIIIAATYSVDRIRQRWSHSGLDSCDLPVLVYLSSCTAKSPLRLSEFRIPRCRSHSDRISIFCFCGRPDTDIPGHIEGYTPIGDRCRGRIFENHISTVSTIPIGCHTRDE